MVNKFLGAVCLPTDKGLCLPFSKKKSIDWIWVLVNSDKIQRSFNNHFYLQIPVYSARDQGGKPAPTHLLAFFCSFLSLSWQEFGALSVACELREALSHLELLGRHVVNPGVVCTALPQCTALSCHGQGQWGPSLQPHSTHGAWASMLPLAWPKYCSHSHHQQKALLWRRQAWGQQWQWTLSRQTPNRDRATKTK